jgi:branched-chain amino acid aminotransferase
MPYDDATLTELCRRVVRDNDLKSASIRPLVFYGAEGMELRADNLKAA